jgi:hypothetical protein
MPKWKANTRKGKFVLYPFRLICALYRPIISHTDGWRDWRFYRRLSRDADESKNGRSFIPYWTGPTAFATSFFRFITNRSHKNIWHQISSKLSLTTSITYFRFQRWFIVVIDSALKFLYHMDMGKIPAFRRFILSPYFILFCIRFQGHKICILKNISWS